MFESVLYKKNTRNTYAGTNYLYLCNYIALQPLFHNFFNFLFREVFSSPPRTVSVSIKVNFWIATSWTQNKLAFTCRTKIFFIICRLTTLATHSNMGLFSWQSPCCLTTRLFLPQMHRKHN